MRFLEMWNPLTFVGYDIASKEQVDQTLHELFSVKPHIAVIFSIAVAALSAVLGGSVETGLLALVIAGAGLLFRYFTEKHFKARKSEATRTQLIRLLVIASAFSIVAYAMSLSLLFYIGSPAPQMLVMAVGCAIVQGAAGRAYMMPGTALFNIAIVIGMLSISAVAGGNYLVPVFGLIYFAFLSGFVIKMVENRERQLEAELKAELLFKEIVEKNELLRLANEALATKAHEDALTGLANRRKLDFALPRVFDAAKNEGYAVSMLIIDVDHFKNFNDTYGHQAGDECLQTLSKVIKQAVTVPDGLVARYGGEEFVVILPRTGKREARAIAELIRMRVSITNLDTLPNSPPPQTISVGLACTSDCAPDRDAMLQAADQALYDAKKLGRNRVCAHAKVTVERRSA